MKRLLFSALLAACACPAWAQVTAPAISPLGPDGTLLSLTAEGKSQRTPDIALFNSGVVTQGATAAEALSQNSARMERVVAALKRAGIADRDIQTSAISLQPRYSNPELEAQIRARETRQPYVPPTEAARIIGYEARNNVQVRVRRIANMGKIIDTLIEAGANEVNGPSFTLDQPEAAQDEARAEAVAVGRKRAELYARAARLRVNRILSMSEGGGYYPMQQIFVTGMHAERGGPAPPPPPPAPVMAGELQIGVSLSMQFELVR